MWLDHAWRDLRYTVRALGRTPAFTAVAALMLALGIGANSAMFSIVYGILLRPLPYRDADRLVLVQREQDVAGAHRPIPAPFFSPGEMDPWQRLQSFDSSAWYSGDVTALSTDAGTELVDSAVVSGSFFATLSGPIAAGRPLAPTDDLAPTAVISERLSERIFGSPERAIGRRLILSSTAYTIAGVADSALQFPTPGTDVWMPAGVVRTLNPRCCGFRLLGRLKPQVTIAAAAAEVAASVKTLPSTAFQARSDLRGTAVRLGDQLVATVRPALLILFAAVSLVLLVACANVVNLLLARQVTRARETAIRCALGASRARLMAQSLTESVVLAAVGTATGIGLAIASVRTLTRWQPPGIPRLDAIHVDVPVLLFSVALAGVTAVAAGLVPALRATRTVAVSTFGAAATTTAPGGRRIRSVLCAAELGVSVVLLIGASLLGRSLVRLMYTDIGVVSDHVVTASLNVAFGTRPNDAQTLERVDRVIARIQTLPGVSAVGAGTALPPNASRLRLTLRKRSGDALAYQAAGVAATPDYFQALGMRLVSGRLFTPDDDRRHPEVMIMSVGTARRFFGDGDPVGRTMSLPVSRNGKTESADMTLVGTIADVKYSGLDVAADDAVYRPFKQQTWTTVFLVARTVGAPQNFVPTLSREIAAVDRGMVVGDVRALDSIISDATASPRFRALVLATIAGLAFLMAIVGLYGVVAYSVAQRTREIGIRMALGARASDVLAMVVREGFVLALAGVAGGLALAIAASRAMSSLLYGIAPTDPASFGLTCVTMLIVAMIASYLPARRATRVDPLAALRDE